MKVNYEIMADVVDINKDTPSPSDSFFVDTNVWFWMHYTKASMSSRDKRIKEYSDYISKSFSNKSILYRNGLSMSELCNKIEDIEREIFENRTGTKIDPPKCFRHNYDSEWKNTVGEMQGVWAQVSVMSQDLDYLVNEKNTNDALDQLAECRIDPYDLFFLKAMESKRITKIITGDGCFSTVSGITVFTANQAIITMAEQQKRLIIR